MSDLPQISEAEYEVMKIVWKHAPINTNEITEKLLQSTSWSPKTIQSLMLSAYIENDKLTEPEIETLRSLLSKRGKKGGD